MASPVSAQLIMAEIRFTWCGQNVENRLHFRGPSSVPSAANLAALATVIDNSVISDWLSDMAANCTYREVYLESYQGGASISHTLGTGGVGGAAGESMAPQNSFCLSLRTAFTGRDHRGRFYTIGMSESHQTAGIVTATYRDSWLNSLRTLLADADAAGFDMVVASFITGGLPRVTAQQTPVTAIISVDDYVDSQRRRGIGRGN